MTDEVEPGLSDQYRFASPWPVFVALGFALSEVGIFLNLPSLAVGGLLLLGGSVAGILRESAYADSVWVTLAGLGVLFGALGGALLAVPVLGGDPISLGLPALGHPNGFVARGKAVLAAATILVVVGFVGAVSEKTAV